MSVVCLKEMKTKTVLCTSGLLGELLVSLSWFSNLEFWLLNKRKTCSKVRGVLK